VCSINNKYYKGAIIYIRAINIHREGEQYGTYYQAVRSYREGGKVKQAVIHLGEHSTVEEALAAWPQEIQELRTTRPKQAEKLQSKLDRLQELMNGAKLTPT
jgi:phosphotransacetylase